jgi:hypothetical protein
MHTQVRARTFNPFQIPNKTCLIFLCAIEIIDNHARLSQILLRNLIENLIRPGAVCVLEDDDLFGEVEIGGVGDGARAEDDFGFGGGGGEGVVGYAG